MKSSNDLTALNRPNISGFLVDESQTIWEAMQAIADNSREVVFVKDSAGRVTGVITDGDIRRGLLRGLTFTAPATAIMTRKFYSVKAGTDRAFILDLMRTHDIRHVPEVDGAGGLQAIHFLRDLIGAAERPNLAVIMAGGRGVRLQPLTESLPKPLVPVAGRPILERLIMHLVGYGIRRVAISINYLGHMIEEHFGDGSHLGCSISYLREDVELGTGGALRLLPQPEEHPILVLNGDLVTQVDVAKLLEFHERQGSNAAEHASGAAPGSTPLRNVKATMTVKNYQHVIPYGVAESQRGRLTALVEKPCLSFSVNAGIYVLHPEVVDLVETGVNFPITRLFEKCLAHNIPVEIFPIEEDWRDVGSIEELMAARGHSNQRPGG